MTTPGPGYPPNPGGQQPGYQGAPGQPGAPGYQAAPGYQPGPVGGGPRPGSVRTAQLLMYVGAALSILALVAIPFTMDQIRDAADDALAESGQSFDESMVDATIAASIGIVVVFAVIGAVLWLVMAHFNGKGRSWARITATILCGINVFFVLISFLQPQTVFQTVFNVLSALVGAVAVVYLWRPDASAWFQAGGTRS